MRAQLLQAIVLVAALHAVGPMVAPRTISPADLPAHLGEQVALEGRVVDVEPGETVTRVEVVADGATTRVLSRSGAPPLGALVRVVGDASPDRGGPVLWANGPFDVLEAPGDGPLALATLLAEAPERAGTAVRVLARFDPATESLVGHQEARGSLAARFLTEPPPEAPVLAWGQLRYDAEHARYRLDVTGWERWRAPAG